MINIEDIEKIIQVVDKFNVSHFEFQQENSKIIIDNNKISEVSINEISKIGTKVLEPKAEKAPNEEVEEETTEKQYIKASFAGTFYSGKEEGGPSFVNLYEDVENDTVVGLLEVMKLFNEIEAGVQGTIIDILVKHGEFVEYGQPLFEIKSK
ncbi:MAG TPA: biotin/lipoyl-containing protein [Clostridium sp.]